MDPVSISLGIVALLPPIAKASKAAAGFIQDVRDARRDVHELMDELHSLETVLNLLKDDLAESSDDLIPKSFREGISDILGKCLEKVTQINDCIDDHTGDRLMKGLKWSASGRSNMIKLRDTLKGYKAALNLAVDALGLGILKDISRDTTEIRHNLSEVKEDTSQIKTDTNQILEGIASLKARLPDTHTGDASVLHRYLEGLTTFAEDSYEQASSSSRGEPFQSSDIDSTNSIAATGIRTRSVSPEDASAQVSDEVTTSPSPSATVAITRTRTKSSSASTLRLGDTHSNPGSSGSDLSWFGGHLSTFSFPGSLDSSDKHSDLVYSVSKGKNVVVSASKDKSIRVWNWSTGRLHYPALLGHTASVYCVLVDDVRDLIISCSSDCSLKLWQLSTGKLKTNVLKAHEKSISMIKMNSRYLISASKDETAKVWDISLLSTKATTTQLGGGRCTEAFPQSVLRGHNAAVNAVVMTEERAYTATADGHILEFDIETGRCFREIDSDDHYISALTMTSSGQYLVSAGKLFTISIHSLETGRVIATLTGHQKLVRTIVALPDEDTFVSGSYDETVAIWTTTDQKTWRSSRSLDVPETQRKLGVHDERNDFTGNVRKIVEAGVGPEPRNTGVVLSLHSSGRHILCGAGSTVIGWNFEENDASRPQGNDKQRLFHGWRRKKPM